MLDNKVVVYNHQPALCSNINHCNSGCIFCKKACVYCHVHNNAKQAHTYSFLGYSGNSWHAHIHRFKVAYDQFGRELGHLKKIHSPFVELIILLQHIKAEPGHQ